MCLRVSYFGDDRKQGRGTTGHKALLAMAIAMETAKLVTAGWLARRWRSTAWVTRLALMAFVFGLAVFNATGVYAQLVSAHVGERGVAAAGIGTQDAELAARVEVGNQWGGRPRGWGKLVAR